MERATAAVWAIALTAALMQTGHAASAKKQVDDFDGATRVWIDPHGLNCGMTMVCPSLGARWSSNEPDAAVLSIELLNTYAPITGAQLNIGGQFVDLVPLTHETRYSHSGGAPGVAPTRRSNQDYLVPLEMVGLIANGASVKLRLSTADGFVDGVVIDGGKASKAHGAMQRFMAQVPYQPKASAPVAAEPGP